MSTESVMPPNHLLCRPFSSCLQSFPASEFSSESALRIKWPKYCKDLEEHPTSPHRGPWIDSETRFSQTSTPWGANTLRNFLFLSSTSWVIFREDLKEVKFFLPLPPGLEAKIAVYLEENRNQDLKMNTGFFHEQKCQFPSDVLHRG